MAAAARPPVLWAMKSRSSPRSPPGPATSLASAKLAAREALQQAIREACTAAKIDPANKCERACIGAAGAGRRGSCRPRFAHCCREIISGEIEVVGDMQIALEAAFGEGPGVIVIAGHRFDRLRPRRSRDKPLAPEAGASPFPTKAPPTGSAGAAVSTLLRAIDQSEQTLKPPAEASPLFGDIRRRGGLSSLDELVRAANSGPFCEVVSRDPGCRRCRRRPGPARACASRAENLRNLPRIVVHRLFPEQEWEFRPHWPWWAACFRHSSTVREVFATRFADLIRAWK